MFPPDKLQIEDAINALLQKRGPGKSICPSEVARDLAGDREWRELMGPVRLVAIDLMRQGKLIITQRGKVVDPDNFRGPVRLRQSQPLKK